jgi:hypothetical protein
MENTTMQTITIRDLAGSNRQHKMFLDIVLDCAAGTIDPDSFHSGITVNKDDNVVRILRIAGMIAEWEHIEGILPSNMVR